MLDFTGCYKLQGSFATLRMTSQASYHTDSQGGKVMHSGYFSPRPLGGEGPGSEGVMSLNSAIISNTAGTIIRIGTITTWQGTTGASVVRCYRLHWYLTNGTK